MADDLSTQACTQQRKFTECSSLEKIFIVVTPRVNGDTILHDLNEEVKDQGHKAKPQAHMQNIV